MRIVHISESAILMTGGMARVSWYWKQAFEKRGHEFIHIGPDQVGKIKHVRQFPAAARQYYQRVAQPNDVILAHEPVAGSFVQNGVTTVVVSHGLERRGWEIQNQMNHSDSPRPSLKTRLFFPIWRLSGCDRGLRHATGALLINQEDKAFAIKRYNLKEKQILVFKNGVHTTSAISTRLPENSHRILFSGTWLPRKGIRTLARAAEILYQKGVKLKWVLAGTGLLAAQVTKTWPACLAADTEIIPKFSEQEELGLYQRCNLFVLPSFFEGQPLALLQAMAEGCCCITTNICGQKDVIEHEHNGLLVNPGDASGLAAAIEQAADDLSLQTKLGMNAQLSVQNRDWNIASNEVVDFVESFQPAYSKKGDMAQSQRMQYSPRSEIVQNGG